MVNLHEIRSGATRFIETLEAISPVDFLCPYRIADCMRDLRGQLEHLLERLRIFIEGGPMPTTEIGKRTYVSACALRTVLQNSCVPLLDIEAGSADARDRFAQTLRHADLLRQAPRSEATLNRIAKYFTSSGDEKDA